MKLLIALETSEHDDSVAAPTVALARSSGAEVVLLNVINPLVDGADVVAASRAEALKTVHAERVAYLQHYATHFQPEARTRVEELEHGEDVPSCIARVAEDEQADILAIATNRASGVRGLILGSVAQHLMRISPCPILVIRVE
ncbi:MAG: universal stress protein [Dehalococcoidia bacterium]